jgi:hypothetical protein
MSLLLLLLLLVLLGAAVDAQQGRRRITVTHQQLQPVLTARLLRDVQPPPAAGLIREQLPQQQQHSWRGQFQRVRLAVVAGVPCRHQLHTRDGVSGDA